MGTDETINYGCVFLNQPCPVRAMFKLRPESLVEFCKTCPLKTKEDGHSKDESVFQIVTIAVQQLSGLFAGINEERKRLLDLIEKLALKV